MDRRTFLVGTGAMFVAASLAAEGEQASSTGLKQVGWLALERLPRLLAEFKNGMRQLGYVEGASYVLHERYAEGSNDRLPGLAAELIQLNLDVVVAEAVGPARALQHATKSVPIVFITGDPVTYGFVQSLAHPGGNLTGVANLSLELYPKRIEVLKAALPNLRSLAVVAGPTVRPDRLAMVIQEAARIQQIETLPLMYPSRPEELDGAFAQAHKARAEAVLVTANPFFNAYRDRVIALAAHHRLPTLYEFRDFVEAGGLICYGADNKDIYRRMASYVVRILRGAKPADLPVEQPTKFELVINLKTAMTLGLTIPPSVLARADEVIQ